MLYIYEVLVCVEIYRIAESELVLLTIAVTPNIYFITSLQYSIFGLMKYLLISFKILSINANITSIKKLGC
jgi:hypothetical protein